jgi:hypothetical protein
LFVPSKNVKPTLFLARKNPLKRIGDLSTGKHSGSIDLFVTFEEKKFHNIMTYYQFYTLFRH